MVWQLLTVAIAATLFMHGSRETTLASHDAVLRPDLSGYVVLETGPVFPDVRVPSGAPIGLGVQLGKTDAGSLDEPYFDQALLTKQLDDLVAAGSGVLTLYTHNIALTNLVTKSHVTLASLTRALQLVRERGLRFYTMSELGAWGR